MFWKTVWEWGYNFAAKHTKEDRVEIAGKRNHKQQLQSSILLEQMYNKMKN